MKNLTSNFNSRVLVLFRRTALLTAFLITGVMFVFPQTDTVDEINSFDNDSNAYSDFGNSGFDETSGFDTVSDFDSIGFDTGDTSSITFSGNAVFNGRMYVDKDLHDKNDGWLMNGDPSFTLGVTYEGASTDVEAKLSANKQSVKDHNEDLLEELTLRAYLGDFIIEGGKMKIVWGKGDKLHVLDNFNANDFTDFIIPDYIYRRIAEPMFHIIWNTSSGIRTEAVYTPVMTADRFASEGIWVPDSASKLTETVTEIIGYQATAALINNDVEALYSRYSAINELVPSTQKVDYSQAGFRLTGTISPVDFGVSYYYGHYKQPSADLSGLLATKAKAESTITADVISTVGAKIADPKSMERSKYTMAYIHALQNGCTPSQAALIGQQAALDYFKTTSAYTSIINADTVSTFALAGDSALPVLDYDRVQIVGLETAAALWLFNIRGEAAYYLTDDINGDNPWVHNNSIQWVGGFDIDLPVHNININIQENGKYILKRDQIGSDANKEYEKYDVDYDENGRYSDNKLVFNVSDTFLHERLNISTSVLWDIEYKDVMIMPKITYTIKNGLDVNLSGFYLTGDDSSQFAQWQNNTFVQLGMSYKF